MSSRRTFVATVAAIVLMAAMVDHAAAPRHADSNAQCNGRT